MEKRRATIIFDDENSLNNKDKSTDNQEDLIPTFDVNMRLDNHTRNAVLALAKASSDKRTASEMVSILVENYLKDSSERTKEIYNDLLNMYEERDKLSYKLKTKK